MAIAFLTIFPRLLALFALSGKPIGKRGFIGSPLNSKTLMAVDLALQI
jgi:hypothetical protein